MKILMVCLGNICRSPLAEGILKHKVAEQGLDWTVDSAGTGSWHVGEQPDRRSIEVAKKHGLDITEQRARQFRPQDFEAFDRILVMDSSNFQDVLGQAQKEAHRKKVDLLLNSAYPKENRNVPDPYWDNDGFEKVFQMVEEACAKLIEEEQEK